MGEPEVTDTRMAFSTGGWHVAHQVMSADNQAAVLDQRLACEQIHYGVLPMRTQQMSPGAPAQRGREK
jgi:hypothetical protein